MAEIGFYHLTRGGPDSALPALLGRTLSAGKRALVLSPDAERLAALDTALWLSQSPDWLPHGLADAPDADRQPILLATRDAADNAASFLFLLDGASAELARFERVFDLFDGRDDQAVAAARLRWTAAKAGGHALTYWQQTETGWVKKATG
jgi:DNA polymerase-3 subunit chi